MLSNIAFKQISGNYWYGAYGEFKVVMMKDSGFINATKLCTSGGKDYKNWSRLQSSQELINAVERHQALKNTQVSFTLQDANAHICALASPPYDSQSSDVSFGKLACKSIITQKKTDIDKLISGTYCHPLLIPHIGSWISVNFAVNVSTVVNGYIEHQYMENIHGMKLQCETAQQAKKEAIQQTQQLEKVVKTKKLQLDTWGNSHAFTMARLNNLNDAYPYYAIR